MNIEQTNDEILIRVSRRMKIGEIQEILNFIHYKELVSKFSAKQSTADAFAKAINKNWWIKNKKKILNEIGR